jgi:sterol desaturase/sphingolipid hydroxylase (fatty acid hydroxylase superfamily)
MTEGALPAVRLAVFAAALLGALALQRLSPHARLRPSWRVNGALAVVNALVLGAVCGACACAAARWAARAGVGLLHSADAGPLLAIVVSVVALDLVSYGWHRANHRVPALWRFHQVHHSDPTFTAWTGLRFHPGELLLSLPLRLAAVVLLGAPVEAVLVFETLFTVANLIEHGDIALPRALDRPLARVLVTPALHRRHHTRVGRARDTNFGTIFSVWDRLLGTYTQTDPATVVQTGLPGLDDLGLVQALVLPLRRRPVASGQEDRC